MNEIEKLQAAFAVLFERVRQLESKLATQEVDDERRFATACAFQGVTPQDVRVRHPAKDLSFIRRRVVMELRLAGWSWARLGKVLRMRRQHVYRILGGNTLGTPAP